MVVSIPSIKKSAASDFLILKASLDEVYWFLIKELLPPNTTKYLPTS